MIKYFFITQLVGLIIIILPENIYWDNTVACLDIWNQLNSTDNLYVSIVLENQKSYTTPKVFNFTKTYLCCLFVFLLSILLLKIFCMNKLFHRVLEVSQGKQKRKLLSKIVVNWNELIEAIITELLHRVVYT